jgi:hydrogenase nickel incorporation protein HypB
MRRNEEEAAGNRALLDSLEIFGINIMSSPGSGKTTLLESLGRILGSEMAVIEGDVKTRRDAERLEEIGIRAWQIETGGACHLDAHSVGSAISSLGLRKGVQKFLVIENVGNLICPSSYDLGERLRVGLLSLPEGDDKILKYPSLFSRIDLLLLTKTDLAPYLDFDLGRAEAECRSINAGLETIAVSSKTGAGVDEVVSLLRKRYGKIWGGS